MKCGLGEAVLEGPISHVIDPSGQQRKEPRRTVSVLRTSALLCELRDWTQRPHFTDKKSRAQRKGELQRPPHGMHTAVLTCPDSVQWSSP